MQFIMPGEEGSVTTLCYCSMTLCSPLSLQIYKFDDLKWKKKNNVLYLNNTVMVFDIASDVTISSFLLLFFVVF